MTTDPKQPEPNKKPVCPETFKPKSGDGVNNWWQEHKFLLRFTSIVLAQAEEIWNAAKASSDGEIEAITKKARSHEDELDTLRTACHSKIQSIRDALGIKVGTSLMETCRNIGAEIDQLRKERETILERLRIESQLACDLRSSQDEIIERCAKAIEDFPEAALRLREHCGNSENTAVSGEDFGELRRKIARLEKEIKISNISRDAAKHSMGVNIAKVDALTLANSELVKDKETLRIVLEKQGEFLDDLESKLESAQQNVCSCGSINIEHGCDYCDAMTKFNREIKAQVEVLAALNPDPKD